MWLTSRPVMPPMSLRIPENHARGASKSERIRRFRHAWIRTAVVAILMPLVMPIAVDAATSVDESGELSADVLWDGSAYLRIPVRLGSDTRLVMPEPFDESWERDREVACTLLDPHTLIIRPRTASVEQRLTLRGRKSGTLYLARVSSNLPYVPIVKVENIASATGVPLAPTWVFGQSGVIGLVKHMMLGVPPLGFQVQKSDRVIFDHQPYRIIAEQVWQSRRETGIIAHLSLTGTMSTPVSIVPANIRIRIPALGTLRVLAADDLQLGAAKTSTRIYLVYES
jgi:hypothetical protein